MKLHQNILFLFLLLGILFKSSHGNTFGGRDKGEDDLDTIQKDLDNNDDAPQHFGPTSVDLSFIILRPNDHLDHMISAKIKDFVHKLNDTFKHWFKFSTKYLFIIYDEHCYHRDLIQESDHSDCNKMLFSYRKGGCDTLNYFIIGDAGHRGDAYGYYPWRCKSHQATDSVWFKYNAGYEAIMAETGAWFGLLYTWGYWYEKHGCSNKNDYVDDTAPSRTWYHSYFDKHAKCVQEFSCGHGHKDAIENYMGPGSPSCRKKFTHGQYDRAWKVFFYYRRKFVIHVPPHRALRHSEEE